VKSVIDKLKYQLVLPPVMLMAVMAMEGEPRDTECKLHLINDAVIWNACPKVYFHLWWLHEGSVKNNNVNISRVLFRTYGALFAVEMQQNGVHSAYKYRYFKSNGSKLSFHSVLS